MRAFSGKRTAADGDGGVLRQYESIVCSEGLKNQFSAKMALFIPVGFEGVGGSIWGYVALCLFCPRSL
jgi:hypothetical protein